MLRPPADVPDMTTCRDDRGSSSTERREQRSSAWQPTHLCSSREETVHTLELKEVRVQNRAASKVH